MYNTLLYNRNDSELDSESVVVVNVQGPVGGPVAGMPGGMDMRPGMMYLIQSCKQLLLVDVSDTFCDG